MTMILERYQGYNIRQTVKGNKLSRIHIDCNGLRNKECFSTVQSAKDFIDTLI